MKEKLLVNGREVEAEFTESNIEEILLPLLWKLTETYRAEKKRILVMLAAPPGAGKSTLSLFLEQLSRTRAGLEPLKAVGMDGFHRYRGELLRTYTVRDGREVTLNDIKGAPETFDLPKLESAVRRLLAESVVTWPLYDRTLHDPVEDALTVRENIVLLEGNYLLLDAPGWRDLRNYADYTVRILADPDTVRERLVERKAASGIARAEAERFAEMSDLYNVRTVIAHFLPADLTLRLTSRGSYEIV